MGKDDSASRIIAGMPMYNEEETIGTVVTMALRHVDEVICIDDGSSDSSARIAEACGATVIRHRSNQGYGSALKTLFQTTNTRDADVLVVLDSDGQHDTSDIPKLIQPILDGEADFTIGSRFVEGGEGNSMPALSDFTAEWNTMAWLLFWSFRQSYLMCQHERCKILISAFKVMNADS